ncbi:glycosyltransferase [Pontibacter chitinilyticus]|uniref:glycosyltransferase n=1 Tax=Pontibacter chitinilyticus TaxID=2674989 RepID=UPI0032197F5C
MKVLHVSTSARGGAGIAAMRLHKGLLAADVNSKFLSLDSSTAYLAKIPRPRLSILKRVLNRSKNELKNLGIYERKTTKEVVKTEGNYEIFSSPVTEYDITLHPDYQEADIIHLHWVANFLDYPSFFRKNKKPVVWTLHDMNPFQGGFHYLGDKQRNQQLYDLEENYRNVKREALSHAQDVHIVCLSNWLLQESQKSEVLGSFPHHLIPNGINLEIFRPLDKFFSREVFRLPQDKTIILFISDNVNNYRKGFDLLLEVIGNLKERTDVVFCAVGAKDKAEEAYDSQIFFIESIRDEHLLALLYSAADAFVLPSREDNLPNVMLEAMACGLPVISTPVGGMLDVIKNNRNGITSKSFSVKHLQEAILSYTYNKESFIVETIRNEINQNYSSEKQVMNYVKLYDNILCNSGMS